MLSTLPFPTRSVGKKPIGGTGLWEIDPRSPLTQKLITAVVFEQATQTNGLAAGSYDYSNNGTRFPRITIMSGSPPIFSDAWGGYCYGGVANSGFAVTTPGVLGSNWTASALIKFSGSAVTADYKIFATNITGSVFTALTSGDVFQLCSHSLTTKPSSYNGWHRVTVTQAGASGGTLSLYIDGIQVETFTGAYTAPANIGIFCLASSSELKQSDGFTWSRVLSTDEIAALGLIDVYSYIFRARWAPAYSVFTVTTVQHLKEIDISSAESLSIQRAASKTQAVTQGESLSVIKQASRKISALTGYVMTLRRGGARAITISSPEVLTLLHVGSRLKAINVTSPNSLTVLKQGGKPITLASISQSVSLSNRPSKIVIASSPESLSLQKVTSRTVSATQGESVSLALQPQLTLSVSQAESVSLVNLITRVLLFTSDSALAVGVIRIFPLDPFLVVSDEALDVSKQISTALALQAIGQSVSLNKQAQPILTVLRVQSLTLVKTARRIISVLSPQAVTVAENAAIQRHYDAFITQGSFLDLDNRLSHNMLFSQPNTASLQLQGVKNLSVSQSNATTVTFIKHVSRVLSAAQAQSVSLLHQAALLKTLLVTQGSTTLLIKTGQKLLSTTFLGQAASLLKTVGKNVSVSQPQSLNWQLSASKAVFVQQANSSTLGHTGIQFLTFAITQDETPTVARQAESSFSVTQSSALSLVRQPSTFLSITQGSAALLSKLATKLLNVISQGQSVSATHIASLHATFTILQSDNPLLFKQASRDVDASQGQLATVAKSTSSAVTLSPLSQHITLQHDSSKTLSTIVSPSSLVLQTQLSKLLSTPQGNAASLFKQGNKEFDIAIALLANLAPSATLLKSVTATQGQSVVAVPMRLFNVFLSVNSAQILQLGRQIGKGIIATIGEVLTLLLRPIFRSIKSERMLTPLARSFELAPPNARFRTLTPPPNPNKDS